MGTLMSRLAPLGLVLTALAAAVACYDAPTSPGSQAVPVHLEPRFAPVAGASTNPASEVDNVHIVFRRADGSIAVDTIVDWPADQDTLRADIVLEVTGDEETFGVRIEGRRGEDVLFESDVENFTVSAEGDGGGGTGGGTTLSTELEYTGNEQNAASLAIDSAAALILAGDTLRLSAEVRDSAGDVMTDVTVVWTSLDTTVATVDTTGRVRAGPVVGDSVAVTGHVQFFRSVIDTVRFAVRTAGITLSPDTGSVDALGDTLEFTAAALDVNGDAVDGAEFSWALASTTVGELVGTTATTATVVSRAVGETRLNATLVALGDSLAESAALRVTQAVDSMDVSPASDTLNAIGDSLDLTAQAWDANGNEVAGAGIEWTSRDTAIATVNAMGRVVSKAQGSTWIRAAAGGVADSTRILVRQLVAVVALTAPADTMLLADTAHFTATAEDSAGTVVESPDLSWTSSDAAVATVDSAGRVAAVGRGSAVISAGAGGAADSATVRVVQIAAELSVSPRFAAVTVGQDTALAVTAIDTKGLAYHDPPVAWSSGNAAVASVDDAGTVTAVAGDTTPVRIGAELDGLTDTVTIAAVDTTGIVSTAFVDSVPEAEASPGRVVAVPVTFDMSRVSADGDLGSVEFELRYDTAVLRYDSAAVHVSGSGVTNEPSPGTFSFAFASTSPQGSGDLTLVTVYFTVPSGATDGAETLLDLDYTAAPSSTDFVDYAMPVTADGRLRVSGQ